ncbi:MAG: hypothetical protein WBI55_06680 [Eubacteriales bacterium]|nr:hypothetical protein [Clostridiales bacterium]
MDRNQFKRMLAAKLVARGLPQDIAVRESVAFTATLSDSELSTVARANNPDAAISSIADAIVKSKYGGVMQRNSASFSQATGRTSSSDFSYEDEDNLSTMLKGKTQRKKPQPKRTVERTPLASRPQPQRPRDISELNVTRSASPEDVSPRQAQRPIVREGKAELVSPSPVRRMASRGAGLEVAAKAPGPSGLVEPAKQPPQRLPRQLAGARPLRPVEKSDSPSKSLDRKIHKPDPNADYTKFWTIFICSSPLWGAVLLFGITFFILLLGALCAAVVGLIIGLVIFVAGGTIVSLVGIIYGITQLFKYVPIGLYEIGLGITAGGVVMYCGIIMYNAAIRFFPYLIRKTAALFIFTARRTVELYYYVKGACADL